MVDLGSDRWRWRRSFYMKLTDADAVLIILKINMESATKSRAGLPDAPFARLSAATQQLTTDRCCRADHCSPIVPGDGTSGERSASSLLSSTSLGQGAGRVTVAAPDTLCRVPALCVLTRVQNTQCVLGHLSRCARVVAYVTRATAGVLVAAWVVEQMACLCGCLLCAQVLSWSKMGPHSRVPWPQPALFGAVVGCWS